MLCDTKYSGMSFAAAKIPRRRTRTRSRTHTAAHSGNSPVPCDKLHNLLSDVLSEVIML